MAMTYAEVKVHEGEVFYAPSSWYEYLARERSDLPGAPFVPETEQQIGHGVVDQLSLSEKPPEWERVIMASVNTQSFTLDKLFPSLDRLKIVMKTALQNRANQAAVIAAQDQAYANSVDEIGVYPPPPEPPE